MIEVRDDTLMFSFPEVHPEAKCSVVFQRTLRLPEDGGPYPEPPGLGRFPISHLVGDPGGISGDGHGGNALFFPMYQAEASWIVFVGWYPFAIKVVAGRVNAITGRSLRDERLWRPQDYVVVPRKPWMEWFCVGNGRARQFVALPLGEGVEGDSSGGECPEDNSIRITAHPMRAERYREYRRKRSEMMSLGTGLTGMSDGTGPAPSWLVHDEAWGEDYGHGAWELTAESQCCVYPVNSLSYMSLTGHCPPGRPPTVKEYRSAGLPWLEHYGEDRKVFERSRALCS